MVHSADEVMDVDAWRAEIRRQARADKIKVRTGFNDGLVWALRRRPDPATYVRDIQRYRDLLAHTVPLAVDLGHEPTLSLWDGEGVLCACDRCSARGYGDVVDDVIGALFGMRAPPRPRRRSPRSDDLRAQLAQAIRQARWSDRDVTRG